MLEKLKNKGLLRTDSYINGTWVGCDKKFAVVNPFDGELIALVSDHGAETTRQAINAASNAFGSWSGFTASKRSRILKNWYDLLLSNVEDLGIILTSEQGKPFNEAKGEIRYGAGYVEWFAEEARRVYGDVI